MVAAARPGPQAVVMPEVAVPEPMLPIKKPVALTWRGHRLRFDVAQDLFSSHQVDTGSRMLLDSLDPAAFPEVGAAADFGCGYGVLGIAWQAANPAWAMDHVDRDALAVAFSRHNAAQLGDVTARFTPEIALAPPPRGYRLVLWNVPGKAGRPVLAGLLDATIDALAPGGVLAVVVVHPLADLFVETGDSGVIGSRDDVAVTHVDRGREHTVVHLRRAGGAVRRRDPFAEGVFDREAAPFGAAGLAWSLTPVVGLPEYDELGYGTRLATEAVAALRAPGTVDRWLVLEPGVGHLALAARALWPDAQGVLAGRDVLALRASARALGDYPVEVHAIWGPAALAVAQPVDVAIATVPAQADTVAISALVDALERCSAGLGQVILHGRSTDVSRAVRELRRRSRWRTGKPSKHRGYAAVAARISEP